MGGSDTIKGIGYQNAYTLHRLLSFLDEDSQIQAVAVEGSGEDVEDLTIAYADGAEEAIQVKKRETREGPYGLWGLADVKPIVAALYDLSKSGRNVTVFRFVATGSAHPRVIDIQRACQRLREGTFAQERDGRAVADTRAMIDVSEEQARDFMRHLWLDVPLESEAHFEQAAQVYLMKTCGIPTEAVARVYNDLYKRVLDKGKEARPENRVITRRELLGWLETPRDSAIGESARVVIRQRIEELRGKLIGADIGEITQGTVEVNQEVDKVDKGGAVTGIKIDKL
jgi:hypothetical protein